MSGREPAVEFAKNNRDAYLEDFKALLRISSISTLPEHKAEVLQAARWIAEKIRELGFESLEITETEGHPVVSGEWMKAGSEVPTILVYGHYDVQPPEPLDEWESEPFDPQIRNFHKPCPASAKLTLPEDCHISLPSASESLFFNTQRTGTQICRRMAGTAVPVIQQFCVHCAT